MTKRIIYTNEDGGVSIVVPALNSGLTVKEIAAKDIPDGVEFEIIDTSIIPTERTFRNAWRKNGKAIKTDLPAAVEIAHTVRRSMRDAEMKPLDIKATIPAEANAAEASRQLIRSKYETMQTDIDDSSDEAGLLAAMDKME